VFGKPVAPLETTALVSICKCKTGRFAGTVLSAPPSVEESDLFRKEDQLLPSWNQTVFFESNNIWFDLIYDIIMFENNLKKNISMAQW